MSDVLIAIKASIQDFQSKMATAKAEMDDLATKGSATSSKLASLGKGLAEGLAGGAVALGAASIDLAEKFQQSTATLVGQAGISANAAKKIGDAFLSTAGKSTFTAQAMMSAYSSVAGQLGQVEGHALTAKQAMDVMNASTELAEATGSSLTSSTSDLATVMQAYGIKAKDAASVTGALFNIQRLTGNSIDTVTKTVQKLHTQLGAMTPPLSQVGGLMVDLASHGESGRAALSAVNTAMTNLLKPITAAAADNANLKAITDQMTPSMKALADQYTSGAITSKQWSAAIQGMAPAQASLMSQFASATTKIQTNNTALSELGIQVQNAQGQFVGMGSIIAQLQPKLEGMTQAQQLATLQQVFGAGANRKLLDVVLAGPAAYDKATKAVADQTRVHTAAEAQMHTLEGQIKMIKAAFEDEGVKIGNFLIPKLEDLMKDVEKVVGWFTKHKAIAEGLAIALGAVGAVLLGAYGISAFKSLTQRVQESYSSIGNLFSKITGSSSEVEGDLEGQGTAAEQSATDFSSATQAITGSMSTLQANIASSVAAINADFASIGTAASNAVTAANTQLAELKTGALGTINEDVTLNGDAAAAAIGDAMDTAGTAAAGEITGAMDTAGTVAAGEITGGLDTASTEAAGELAAGIKEGALASADGMAGSVGGAGESAAADIGDAIKGSGELAAGDIGDGIKAAGELAAADMGAAIKTANIGSGGGNIIPGGSNTEQDVKNIESDAKDLGEAGLGAGIGAKIISKLGDLKSTAVDTLGKTSVVAALAALDVSTILQIKDKGLKAYSEHKPTAKDLEHPSTWVADMARGINILLGHNTNASNGGSAGPDFAQNATYMGVLTQQVAKDKTLVEKFATVDGSIQKQTAFLGTEKAWKLKLESDGTLTASEGHLKDLKKDLATEKTLGLSKASQDKTTTEIRTVQKHIDDLRTANSVIAKDTSILGSSEKLLSELKKVSSASDGVKTKLDSGIDVKHMPSEPMRATGVVKLVLG